MHLLGSSWPLESCTCASMFVDIIAWWTTWRHHLCSVSIIPLRPSICLFRQLVCHPDVTVAGVVGLQHPRNSKQPRVEGRMTQLFAHVLCFTLNCSLIFMCFGPHRVWGRYPRHHAHPNTIHRYTPNQVMLNRGRIDTFSFNYAMFSGRKSLL